MEQLDPGPLEEFLQMCAKRFCPVCGEAIIPNMNGRPKKFCSDRCRGIYWKRRYRLREKEERIHENARDENAAGECAETG